MCVFPLKKMAPILCVITSLWIAFAFVASPAFASEVDDESTSDDEVEASATTADSEDEVSDSGDPDTDEDPSGDADIDEQATIPVSLSDSERQQLSELSRDLRRQTRSMARAAGSKVPLEPDALLRQIPGSSNPANIFEWMQQNIGYEPYAGSLRGASGTLVAQSANAADQAILANSLLESAGHQTRFVTGRLHEQDAARLLERTLGASELRTSSDSSPISSTQGASLEYSSTMHLISDHIWLEVIGDDQPRSFDPVASPRYGMTVATDARQHDRFPESHQTHFEMRLVSDLDDGQSIEHVIVEGPMSRVAFRALTLSFEDDPIRERGHYPILTLDGEGVRGDPIPVAAVETLELRFRFRSPRHENRWDQTLYRRGYGVDIFDFDHQHFAFAVVPGWTSEAKLRQVADRAAEGALQSIDGWIAREAESERGLDDEERRREINTALDHLGAALPFAFARTLDRTTDQISQKLGVYPILGRPRVLTTGLLRQGEDFYVDLQVDGDRIEALPHIGIPALATTAFTGIHGLIRDHLVSELLEAYGDHEVRTVRRLFEEAADQSIPFTTINTQQRHRLDRLSIDASTRQAIQRQMRRRNMTVLAPLRPVDDDGVERYAWWAVNPHDGNLEGHTSDAILAIGELQESAGLSTQSLLRAHLQLIGRHFSAAYQATSGEDRFPELVCTASRQFQRLSRAYCATSERLPRADITTCLDSPPTPAGDLLSLRDADCADHFAPFRCAAAYSTALLNGYILIGPTGEPTPTEIPQPLCY